MPWKQLHKHTHTHKVKTIVMHRWIITIFLQNIEEEVGVYIKGALVWDGPLSAPHLMRRCSEKLIPFTASLFITTAEKKLCNLSLRGHVRGSRDKNRDGQSPFSRKSRYTIIAPTFCMFYIRHISKAFNALFLVDGNLKSESNMRLVAQSGFHQKPLNQTLKRYTCLHLSKTWLLCLSCRLQLVKNAACRLRTGLNRWHHISGPLMASEVPNL